jgi:hypothetical protein
MNWYRVTVEFNNFDSEGQSFVDKITTFQVAKNEHMACLIVGGGEWADDDFSHLVNVTAVLDTN